MIRQASVDDKEHWVKLAKRYAEKSGHPSDFDLASAERLFDELIAHTGVIFLVNENVTACCVAVMSVIHLNQNDIHSEIVFHWSDSPGDGLRSLKIAEDWSRRRGAKYAVASSIAKRNRTAKYYERQGYTPLETKYIKEL